MVGVARYWGSNQDDYGKALRLSDARLVYYKHDKDGYYEVIDPDTGEVAQLEKHVFTARIVPEGYVPPHLQGKIRTAPHYRQWKAQQEGRP